VSKTLGKGYFTLGKEHSADILSAKGSLPSTFFGDFAECRKALGKKKNTRQIKNRKNKKTAKHFKKIIGTTLQPYLLLYPLPYHFSLLF
jgi:hypothetical protein